MLRTISYLLPLLLVLFVGDAYADDFSLLDDLDLSEGVVEVPEENKWKTVGGPIGLGVLFFLVLLSMRLLIPFKEAKGATLLYHYPTGVKRGLAMAVGLYGIAFLFGAFEIKYQLDMHGSAEAYFANMSSGKLIAFTHAHLFGFTTSFIIVGVPFSLQFNHNKIYQMIFPIGLAAAFIDVASWWGIKYWSANFEVISMACGILFSVSYLWMLIGLLRVLLFPEVIWISDKKARPSARPVEKAGMIEGRDE